jgi:hypothetical protein
MARLDMFRLHAASRTPFTVSVMINGESTVSPVFVTLMLNVAVPPDCTVWFAGDFVTRMAGAAWVAAGTRTRSNTTRMRERTCDLLAFMTSPLPERILGGVQCHWERSAERGEFCLACEQGIFHIFYINHFIYSPPDAVGDTTGGQEGNPGILLADF